MKKNDKQQQLRYDYIRMRCSVVKNKTTEIKKLANELFLSERTIWRELKNK